MRNIFKKYLKEEGGGWGICPECNKLATWGICPACGELVDYAPDSYSELICSKCKKNYNFCKCKDKEKRARIYLS